MPPLDDELRSTLRARAETVPPLPDPLPGVARRARSLRRRRAATAVAGSALAVLGVIGGAALLLPGPDVVSSGPVATSPSPDAPAPSPTATPPAAPSPYALDPASPWPYRSLGAPLPEQEQQAYLRAWSDAHPDDARPPALLFSQRWEPSGLQEVVVLGSSSFGLLRESEAGPDLVSEAPLPAEPLALVTVLGGDEGVSRVLAVASPEVDELSLRSEREADAVVAPLAELAPGVGTGALEPAEAERRVLTGIDDDQPVFTVEVPDGPSRPSEGEPSAAGVPANVLDWLVRGAPVEPDLLRRAQELLVAGREQDARPEEVEAKVLFAGDDDAGNRFLLGQFWLPGDVTAQTLGVVDAPPAGTDEDQHLRVLAADAEVALLRLGPAPGQSRATLVVVPRPGTGQVEYAPDGDTAFAPAGRGQDSLDGVVLLDRAGAADEGRAVDRLRLWDGDGLEPFLTADVPDLLCGVRECG